MGGSGCLRTIWVDPVVLCIAEVLLPIVGRWALWMMNVATVVCKGCGLQVGGKAVDTIPGKVAMVV